MKVTTRSEAETRRFAGEWARELPSGAVVRLWGELGAGKTAFVRGMLEGMGWRGAVTSPTYALVQEYATDPPFAHADLYRLVDPEEVWDLELDGYLERPGVFAVEWSERVPAFWPEDAWQVRLEPVPDRPEHREITIERGDAR